MPSQLVYTADSAILKRLIQKKIYGTIALKLLNGQIKEGSKITFDYDDKKDEFTVK